MKAQNVVDQRWHDRVVGGLWGALILVALGVVGSWDREDEARLTIDPSVCIDQTTGATRRVVVDADEDISDFLAYKDGYRDGQVVGRRDALAELAKGGAQ